MPKRLILAAVLTVASGPALADDIVGFRTPSGNIHCMMIDGPDGAARCDLSDYTPSFPARPVWCDLDWGGSFAIAPFATIGTPVCHGDTTFAPDNPLMGYGSVIQHGGLTCSVKESGVTCSNAAGHGFTVSRARQSVF